MCVSGALILKVWPDLILEGQKMNSGIMVEAINLWFLIDPFFLLISLKYFQAALFCSVFHPVCHMFFHARHLYLREKRILIDLCDSVTSAFIQRTQKSQEQSESSIISIDNIYHYLKSCC